MPLGIGIGINPVTLGQGVGDPIAAYFAAGNNGFDFDFSKTDRLFQDLNNTPAVSAGNNIGLALDPHGWGGVPYSLFAPAQPELVPDPEFDAPASWSVSDGSVVVSGGVVTFTASASNAGVKPAAGLALVTDAYYRAELVIDSISGTFRVANEAGGLLSDAFTTPGTKVLFFKAPSTSALRVRTVGTTTGVISRLSVKRLPGNHAAQSVTNSQPKWQTGGLARADGTDDGVLTAKLLGAAGFVMVKHNTASAPASTKVLCGASGSSTAYGYCGIDSSGNGVARIGTGTAMTSDNPVTGATGTLGFWWDGNNAALLINGGKAKTQVQSGAPTTTIPLALFCLNSNATLASFLGTDGYRFLHGDTAPNDAALIAFHNKLMAA